MPACLSPLHFFFMYIVFSLKGNHALNVFGQIDFPLFLVFFPLIIFMFLGSKSHAAERGKIHISVQ